MSKVLTYDNPSILCLIRRLSLCQTFAQVSHPTRAGANEASAAPPRPLYGPVCGRPARAILLLAIGVHFAQCGDRPAGRLLCRYCRPWRQRWPQTASVRDAPRAGTRRTFRRSSGPRLSRWPVVRHAHTANLGRAGRGDTRPGRVEQQIVAHISPGTIRTWLHADKSHLGALTHDDARLIRTLWTRPLRCSSSTNTPRRWQRRVKQSCAVMRNLPPSPSACQCDRSRRAGSPVHVAERYLGRALCNSSAPWWSLRA